MLNSYISSAHLAILTLNNFASFDALWYYEGDWFEAPNTERGGWSGVNYIELPDDHGNFHGFYLKRQQGHTRCSWLHPIKGEATFVREYKILQYLKFNNSNVKTPTLVFFANQQNKAILLTAALAGYVSADEWFKNNKAASSNNKKKLIAAMALTVRNLHLAGVLHRSLYAKHLFVKDTPHVSNNEFEVAMIDFEKSRITACMAWFRFSDLITLNYRTPEFSRTSKLYFFKQYFDLKILNTWHKALCRYMRRVSYKKSLK